MVVSAVLATFAACIAAGSAATAGACMPVVLTVDIVILQFFESGLIHIHIYFLNRVVCIGRHNRNIIYSFTCQYRIIYFYRSIACAFAVVAFASSFFAVACYYFHFQFGLA